MKKATILFEVTEKETIVISTGTTGKVETFDITGTEIEKDFTKLLGKINEQKTVNQVLDFIDPKKW